MLWRLGVGDGEVGVSCVVGCDFGDFGVSFVSTVAGLGDFGALHKVVTSKNGFC